MTWPILCGLFLGWYKGVSRGWFWLISWVSWLQPLWDGHWPCILTVWFQRSPRGPILWAPWWLWWLVPVVEDSWIPGWSFGWNLSCQLFAKVCGCWMVGALEVQLDPFSELWLESWCLFMLIGLLPNISWNCWAGPEQSNDSINECFNQLWASDCHLLLSSVMCRMWRMQFSREWGQQLESSWLQPARPTEWFKWCSRKVNCLHCKLFNTKMVSTLFFCHTCCERFLRN